MIACPRCTQQNDESDTNCRACGLQLRDPVSGSSTVVKRGLSIKHIIGLIGCVILLLYIAYRIASVLGALP